jgi:hypothetical protein
MEQKFTQLIIIYKKNLCYLDMFVSEDSVKMDTKEIYSKGVAWKQVT